VLLHIKQLIVAARILPDQEAYSSNHIFALNAFLRRPHLDQLEIHYENFSKPSTSISRGTFDNLLGIVYPVLCGGNLDQYLHVESARLIESARCMSFARRNQNLYPVGLTTRLPIVRDI